jgi:hypothetical protein
MLRVEQHPSQKTDGSYNGFAGVLVNPGKHYYLGAGGIWV